MPFKINKKYIPNSEAKEDAQLYDNMERIAWYQLIDSLSIVETFEVIYTEGLTEWQFTYVFKKLHGDNS